MIRSFDSKYGIQEFYPADDLAQKVKDTVSYYECENSRLVERIHKLHDDAAAIIREEYKNEIEYLKELLDLSYGSFSSKKEKEAYDKFEQEHMHDRCTSRYNGGRMPYLIPTSTGVGTHLEVVCPICGAKKDITDTEVW